MAYANRSTASSRHQHQQQPDSFLPSPQNQHAYVNLSVHSRNNLPNNYTSNRNFDSSGYPTYAYSSSNMTNHAIVDGANVTFRENPNLHNNHPPAYERASEIFIVLYDYVSDRDDELEIRNGDEIRVISKDTGEEGWYRGKLGDKIGLFPENYGKLLGDETQINEIRGIDLHHPFTNIEHGRIGTGATADVYRIQYQKQWVALKKFKESLVNKDFVRREALCLSQLSHPNIVKFLGMCLDPSKLGLVLELCQGGSLRSVYKEHKQRTENAPISKKTLIKWARQIACGMEYLCKEGFIHRDLKAENVLVKESVCKHSTATQIKDGICVQCNGSTFDNFTLKITDFGATKTLEAIKDDVNRCSSVGTYAWLAPEAFREQDYSEASDVWSFGVVMWELLVQEDPFHQMVPITIALAISKGELHYEIDQDCPKRWRSIMMSCWEREKEKRPRFSDLVKKLEAYERSEPDGKDEKELQRMQSLCRARDYRKLYEGYSQTQRKELEEIYVSLYEKTPSQGSTTEDTPNDSEYTALPTEWKWRRFFAWKKAPKTETRQQNKQNKKGGISKKDIGHPTEFAHLHSAKVNTCPIPTSSMQSENGSRLDNLSHLQVYRIDAASGEEVPEPFTPEVFGTLPRPEKLSTAGRTSVINASFSRSSPNLNALNIDDATTTNVAPSLRRKDAIRKKGRPSIDTTQGGGGAWTPTPNDSTPGCRDPTTPVEFARIDDAEEDTASNKGTVGKSKGINFWSRLGKKGRSSRESEDADDAALIGNQSSSSISSMGSQRSHFKSSSSVIALGPMTKGPGGPQFLGDRSATRHRAESTASEHSPRSTVALHKVSPAEKAQPRTNRAMTHTADMIIPKKQLGSPAQDDMRPTRLPKASPIGLDQHFPPSPSNQEETSCIPYQYLSNSTEVNAGKASGLNYDSFSPSSFGSKGSHISGLQHMHQKPHAHHHHVTPHLSQVVPLPSRNPNDEEPTHYDIFNGDIKIPPTHYAKLAHARDHGEQPVYQHSPFNENRDAAYYTLYQQRTDVVNNQQYHQMPFRRDNDDRERIVNNPNYVQSQNKNVPRPDTLNLTPGSGGISQASSLSSSSLANDVNVPPEIDAPAPPATLPVIPPREGAIQL